MTIDRVSGFLDILLPSHRPAPAISSRIFDIYGAQLGEMAWHSLHADPTLDAVADAHAASIERLIAGFDLSPPDRPIRLLEVGAYAHDTVHRIASKLGGVGATHDISPTSLRLGRERARGRGATNAEVSLVAGDFHDLPFSDNYFDLVFVASSVHHTWRPNEVISELIRIVRPGGALRLENEPIGRSCCFYKYRSSRPEQFTPFQQHLEERGLTQTITSPFPGSRPEELFGMIENDRIPMELYRRELSRNGRLVEWAAPPLIGPFDEWLLSLPRDGGLSTVIARRLVDEVEAAKGLLNQQDMLMGFSLPTVDEIWLLSYKIAEDLRMVDASELREEKLARLFGAALQATAIKTGDGPASATMLRRQLVDRDGVLMDDPVSTTRLKLESLIPEITDKSEILEKIFDPSEWIILSEAGGPVISNAGASGEIILPGTDHGGIFLLRMYCSASGDPYFVQIKIDDAVVYSSCIAAPESHLAKLIIRPKSKVRFELINLDGSPHAENWCVRIGVAKFLPLMEDVHL